MSDARKARGKAWRLEERKQQHSAMKQRGEDADREEDERSSYCGYTESEHDELLCYGIKPWDDDADSVLALIHGGDDEYYDSNFAVEYSSPGKAATATRP